MSKVEQLILNVNSKDKKSSHQKQDNFLVNLITNLEDSNKLLSLLKDMKITQKELSSLLENKTIPIEIKDKIKTLINSLKEEENILNFSILQNIISKSISNNTLEKTVDNNSLKEEIVKITKEIIDTKIKLNKILLNEKEMKEFKEIKTFKELIDFANKKNLKISKVVTSYFKPKADHKINNTIIPTSNILNKKIDNKNIKDNSNPSYLANILNKENSNINLEQIIPINNNRSNNISLETLINLDNKNSKNYIQKNNNSQENSNNMLLANQTVLDNLKFNIIKAKETIKHFSNNLKEAIENYKPPISKISMELNPKELGKVEVTLIHRGDNLQIQINSNNSAISLFNYNQQELKQNLINMGFNDVNMSFNQQNQQQKGNKEYQQKQKFGQAEEDELIIEIPYKYA